MATAVLLASAGASVALCDRAADELEATVAALGDADDPLRAVLDEREGASAEELVERVIEHHGRIHVLVDNVRGTFVAPFLHTSARAGRR